MPLRTADPALALPLLPAAAVRPVRAAGLEYEVIHLFDQLRDPLLRYALSFGLQAHDGDDIIQEVFLSLFRHLQLGRSRRNLRGWVFRVAHNLALKRRFANQKLQQREEPGAGFADIALDPTPSVEDQLVLNERRARLRAVLRALPEQDQQCLRLRAEGLKYREIAGVLEMSLGAVAISLTRSLARLERADER